MAFRNNNRNDNRSNNRSNNRNRNDNRNDDDTGPLYCGLACSVGIQQRGAVVIPAGGYLILTVYFAGDGHGDDNKLSVLVGPDGPAPIRSEAIRAQNDGGQIVVGLGKRLLLTYAIPRDVTGDVADLIDRECCDESALQGDIVEALNGILEKARVVGADRSEGRSEGRTRRSEGRSEGRTRRSEGRSEGRTRRSEGRSEGRTRRSESREFAPPPSEAKEPAKEGD